MTMLDGSSAHRARSGVASGPEDSTGVEPGAAGVVSNRRPPLALTLLLTVVVGAGVGWAVGGVAALGLPRLSPGARLALLVVVVWLGVLGLWALVSWSRRRARIVDATGVERAAAVPLLAHLEAPDDLTVLPVLDPGSVPAALFVPLRRAVERRVGLPRPLLAVVAGPGRDETPVWVGANLAVALAQAGRRVLLVDAGPPTATTAPDVPGLAGLLGGTPAVDAAAPGPVSGLDVLPPGGSSTGRSVAYDVLDLLGSDLGARLTAATGAYEVVVVVGPTLHGGGATTAGSMAAEADVVPAGLLVLAVAAGRARATVVRRQAERVRRQGCRVLGAVLVTGGPER